MATLNVTNLQNVASTVTNVSLLADGTTSLVLNATGTARTGGIRYNAGTLEVYTGTAWVAAGGGSGTVTGVTASLPLASTGGATPNLSLNLGLGTAVNGSNIAISIPVAATPPTVATTTTGAMNGSLYWDNNLGALFLRYFDGTTAQWVQAAASGNVTSATAAQAAAGALTSVYLSPATGVPKDAATMTGAAILPSGTLAQRPATPTVGMTRVNTTTNSPEAYVNGAWSPIQSTQSGQFAGFRNILINGNFAINQRRYVSGTAVGAANTYTLDRWKVLTSGQSVTFAASGNGNQVTAPAGGLQQVIENVNVGGGVYTLSWTGTATATVNGTAVANGGQVTLPANTQATVTFSGGTVSNAQLEPGSVATPFEQRTVGVELILCQRYFEASIGSPSTDNLTLAAAFQSSANAILQGSSTYFKVVKRVTPTITTFSLPGTAGQAHIQYSGSFGGSNVAVNVNTTAINTSSFCLIYTVPLPIADRSGMFIYQWTASAEL